MSTGVPEKYVFADFSNGDSEAFGKIYTYFKDAVLANILKIIHQPHVAEDILQDTFVKLWENRSRFSDKQSVAAWLFRVSYHSSIDHIRGMLRAKLKTETSLLLEEEGKMENQQELLHEVYHKEALLQEAINMLPPKKRQVFELCKLEGKSYAEVSEALNIAKSTVKDYIIESNKSIKKHVLTKYSQSSYSLLLYIIFEHL
ncbi:MAG: RNA polymerase sigma factor [Bacteroidetes bacterium]|nr:RNA polymerase sigma factor [Bacteroidota bacterium]